MIAEVSVFVRGFSVRALAYDLVDELRRQGIFALVIPSDRTIGMWDVEVLGDDTILARMIADEFSRARERAPSPT